MSVFIIKYPPDLKGTETSRCVNHNSREVHRRCPMQPNQSMKVLNQGKKCVAPIFPSAAEIFSGWGLEVERLL
jgi:hypothetical protein